LTSHSSSSLSYVKQKQIWSEYIGAKLTLKKLSENTTEEYLSDMIKELNNKEGCIRNNILGSRLNFTSRAVITPLSGEYGIDDIVIPYLMGMELLKPVLLNKIKKLKNVSLFKANKLWFNATLKFDNLFYNIMCDIIKKDNIKLLLNRNPTIF
jgi:DNA-directed RNA polymerase beta' subunit